MKPEDAARTLRESFDPDYKYFAAVGIGQKDGQTVLFVYIKSKRFKAKSLPETWEGYKVTSRFTGEFQLCTEGAEV